MGGCAKNSDKKDGKDGAKDSKDGNRANTSGFGLQVKSPHKFSISKEKKLFHVNLSKAAVQLTDSLLEKHLQYLEHLSSNGKLKSCGAYTDGKSGYQVIIANSEEEVLQLINNDPLIQHKYYVNSGIKQLKEWRSPTIKQENLLEIDSVVTGFDI